ncbi:MAG: SulP family inorganic anion transporter [Janthinobacterium lividum]
MFNLRQLFPSQLFPFLQWRRPTAETLKRDLSAGLTVGLVVIPQSIAYATLAGMPPQTGLYAALLPCIVGILWGSSQLLAVGPVALTSLLTFGSLAPLAVPGSAQWVPLAIWLALYAGLMQFALGAFRLGRIADIVSQPVMLGFINAAAFLIILSQLPALTGLPFTVHDWSGPAARHLFAVMQTTPFLITSAFGLAAMLALLALRRLAPRFPAMLFITLAGVLASWLLDYQALGGAVIGRVPAGLPQLQLPAAIPFASHQNLWPAALIIALVSFTEAMSSARVLARKRRERWDENQELIGQGMAKLTAALCGTFPVSGSFSRSALNRYAGAASAWASLVAAGCVLVALLWLTPVLAYLPHSVLAAIILVPMFSLIDLRGLRRMLAISRGEGAIALTTLAVTLLSAPRLHWGVFVGVGLTMLSFLYRRAHPRIAEVGAHPDGTLRDRQRFSLPRLAPDVLALRLDSALNFLTAPKLEHEIGARITADASIRRVLLCASAINDIDVSGVDVLAALHRELTERGIALELCAIKKQVWDVMVLAGLLELIGVNHLYATDHSAVEALANALQQEKFCGSARL